MNYIADKNFDGCFSVLSKSAIGNKQADEIEAEKREMRIGPFDFKQKIATLKILSMNVDSEHVNGTQADVSMTAALEIDYSPDGGGVVKQVYSCRFLLVKENASWKIDKLDIQQRQGGNSTGQQNSPTGNSLDDEAIKAVKDFWEQHTSKCGPSYYGFEDNYPFLIMHQWTGVSFAARRTGPTTEADKLNGILWNGLVQIKTGPYRQKPKGTEWSEWKQDQNMVDEIGATKRQSGGWSVVQMLHITKLKKVNCSETEF
jgi:hypothetical protein